MALRKLSELADWQLSHKNQDLRGKALYERGGDRIGTVDDMLVDTKAKLVRTIVLDSGERISADDIDIEDDGAYLRSERHQRPKVQVYRHEGGTNRPTAP